MRAARQPVRRKAVAGKGGTRGTAARKPRRTGTAKPDRAAAAARAVGRAMGAISRNVETVIAAVRSPQTRAAAKRRLDEVLADTRRAARGAGRGARRNAGRIVAVAAAVAAAAAAIAAARRRR
jgi:hypothetical protein